MTVIEAKAATKKALQDIVDLHDYCYVAYRFEDADRNVGDIIRGCSKDNPGREDNRDFPEYGTKMYNDLPDADGICSYTSDDYSLDWNFGSQNDYSAEKPAETHFVGRHLYIIASGDCGESSDPDAYEIVLREPVVLAKIF